MEPEEIEGLRDEILNFLMQLPGDETLKLKDLMSRLQDEMKETQADGNDVLFCGSDGKTIIKAVHFPRSALGGEDGPVILPSANPKVILAAFSDEFVQGSLDEVRNVFADLEVREHQWEQFLNGLAAQVSRKHAETEEFDWDFSR